MTSSIRIRESAYEQWIVDHVEDLFGPDATVVARQRNLASGRRPDLLVLKRTILTVVEVKAVKADLAAVGQLLAYVGELRADPENAEIAIVGTLAAPSIEDAAVYVLNAVRGCSFLEIRAVIERRWNEHFDVYAAAVGLVRGMLESAVERASSRAEDE